MKCQECEKQATFHITEIVDSNPREVHLCEDHARSYLSQEENEPAHESSSSIAGFLAQQLAVTQTAEDLARLDQQSCPMCGITFHEFRNKGRLGCPYDYTCFEEDIEPLLANIHGETVHVGKVPMNSSGDTEKQTKVIRLRRELKEAIKDENYEKASELRDEINELEETGKQKSSDDLTLGEDEPAED